MRQKVINAVLVLAAAFVLLHFPLNVSAQNQFALMTASGDLPDEQRIPVAICNAGTAAPGLTLPSSNAPTATCPSYSNTPDGVLQYGASQNAYGKVMLPFDWDSSINPYVRVSYEQNGTTGSQTIAFQVQIACPNTTNDPSYQTAQTFGTSTTGTTAFAFYTQTLQLNSTSMTNCSGGAPMFFEISTTAGSNATSNLRFITITVPRKIVVQAN